MYLHSLDPYAIYFETLGTGIRWYGLAYLSGFAFGYYFMRRLAKLGRTKLKPEQVGDFVFWVALGTIFGGRLGYCLFYDPNLFFYFEKGFPFWGFLALHHGGMASHGGIVGIIVASWLFARKHNLNPFELFDLTTVAGALGIFFGRIANFINAELVGRAARDTLAWAVKFPTDILLWPDKEPERLTSLAPVVQKLGIGPEAWDSVVAGKLPTFNVHQLLNKIVHAVYSGDQAIANALQPVLTPRHPSQIYEALLEGLFIFLAMSWLWTKNLKPGIITAWFLILYCAVRILGEQFRMPDVQIGFQLWGLTRGQWLSVGMMLFSVVYYFWISKRSASPEN